MSEFSLLKDVENGLITVGVGRSYTTMTLGEWSKAIVTPRMYRKPEQPDTSPCEMIPYHGAGIDGMKFEAPPEDCA